MITYARYICLYASNYIQKSNDSKYYNNDEYNKHTQRMKEINEKQNKRRRQRQKSKHKQKHNPHANVVKTFYETKKKTQKRKLNKNKFEIVVLKHQQQHQQQQLCTLNRRTIKDFLFKNEKKSIFLQFFLAIGKSIRGIQQGVLGEEEGEEGGSRSFSIIYADYNAIRQLPGHALQSENPFDAVHLPSHPLHPPAAQHPMKNTQRQPKK